ncbi:MAG: Stp1/IreP family PP2C-type Ser/Thr phosphatase [Candidatus Hydrogenedentes bacterium]|nr:Stp1/IreP family PP2C-type Ser/Thr phosphatase [Candidatus Hydrogenedentota bacterium]
MIAIPLTQIGPSDNQNYEYHWTGEYIEAHLLSDVGHKRKSNQDACMLCVPQDDNLAHRRGLMFAVADGMGGANAGEFASRLALEALIEGYYLSASQNLPDRLRDALEEASRQIFAEAEQNPERHGMGTTLSAFVVHGEWAYVAQVGDSRIYLVRPRHPIVQVTNDHSLVAEQVRNGYISPEEARTHSLKNLITRAVGIKETVKVDLFCLHIQQGDTFLICSDGLCNLVKDSEIEQALENESLQSAARVLVGRALHEGGSDNITTAIIRVTAVPPPQTFEFGAEPVKVPKLGLMSRLGRLLTGG